MPRLLSVALVAVVALGAAVAAKTYLLTPSKQVQVAAVAPAPVDAAAAAGRLAAAVRFKTVAMPFDPRANADQFEALHAHLTASFPKLHALLKREVVGDFGLVYTWQGSDASLPPCALMAHQDVVPVAPGTEGDWQQPPFSGAIAGGFVWGRGAWDDKGNLMSIMEAVEALAASGFRPRQTFYLIFGHDEELGGERGALQVAKLFKQRGIRLQFVVDEGLLIAQGMVRGLDAPAALIGLAEKGHMTVTLTASAAPGHASMPPTAPQSSAIAMLAAALARLDREQLPLEIRGLSRQTFETLAPEMSGVNRVFLSNLWLFRPLVENQLKAAPSMNATLRTTTALTMFHAGNAFNVLPGRASAVVDFRLMPGDRSDAVIEHVTKTVANANIRIEKGPTAEASKVAATSAPGYRLIERTLRQIHPDFVVAPGLMLGGTDSRHFDDLADDIYKFSPIRATSDDLKRFHGTNERISIANYVEMIQFYQQLLRNAAVPNEQAAKTLPTSGFEPMVRRVFAQPRESIYKAALRPDAAA